MIEEVKNAQIITNKSYNFFELQEVELADGSIAEVKKLVATTTKARLEAEKAGLEESLKVIDDRLAEIAGLKSE